MAEYENTVTSTAKKQYTVISIPEDSKQQFYKNQEIVLYEEVFSLVEGYYLIPPRCVIKSKNKERYRVTNERVYDASGNVIGSTICVKYTVHKDNVLPRHTGDSAVIDFKVSDNAKVKQRIIDFKLDTSYVTSTGSSRRFSVVGSPGCKLTILVKNASGIVIKRLDNLVIPTKKKGESQGVAKGSINIPESASATTYTVEVIEGENTVIASTLKAIHTINQYAAAGINVSISSTTSTSLVVTGTTPVALNGIEVLSIPTTTLTAAWVITKGSGVKIYAHRKPTLSSTIAYNVNGSSDYTNTLKTTNGNTVISLLPAVTQTNGTTVTLSLVHKILGAGTDNVSPVLNLDNFISVKPPSFDTVVKVQVGSSVVIKLGSEGNTIPVSSAFMAGNWATVSGPSLGSLGSYGAYNSGTPGQVTFTAPTIEQWEVAELQKSTSFTYKVSDGTTDSDVGTVLINITE